MSETLAIELLAIVILCAAYIWESNDDRLGENEEDKGRDVYIRIGVSFVSAVIASLLTRSHTVLSSWVLAGAIHFFCFDYTIAFILVINKVIDKVNPFEYLGKRSKIDKWKVWRNLTPWQRFGLRVVVLAVAIVLYHKF